MGRDIVVGGGGEGGLKGIRVHIEFMVRCELTAPPPLPSVPPLPHIAGVQYGAESAVLLKTFYAHHQF